jgi:WS/DGAT/MGAT family acyltransferase
MGNMQQLTPMDAAFLYLENETTHAHGTLVWLYDAGDCEAGSVTRKALLDHMRARLPVSPVFTRKVERLPLDFDYPYWVDDTAFELLYHIRERSLATAASWVDFCDLVADVHAQPLDHQHPLWELTLVPGLDGIKGLPQRCFAILGKFHHVAIDGATGMHIINGIHDIPGRPAPAATDTVRSARSPALGESLYRAAIRNLGAMDKGLGLLGLSRASKTRDEPSANEASNSAAAEAEDTAPLPQTLFNQAIDAKATWDSRSFDLAVIKGMRAAVKDATVNDVLLAIVGGGLRHYLEHRDALPDNPMRAGCPINIRTEEEAGAGGNMISAMIVSMHTDIASPIQRLRAITRSSAAAKLRAEQRGSRKILDVTSVVPAQAQALLGQLAGKVSGKLNRAIQFNCSVSNLPGPQQDLYMLGGRLQNIAAAMPIMNGFGLFVGLTTCAGKLNISMSSCDGILPDPEKLGDCMDQSFTELLAATRKKAHVKKPATGKTRARQVTPRKQNRKTR